MRTGGLIRVRAAVAADAGPLAALQNEIIAIGGTTARQVPTDAGGFAADYFTGADCLSCLVADAGPGLPPLGFQAMGRNPELPEDWGDIGTFARFEPKVPGVGTALFAATQDVARALGLRKIFAIIRADNAGGLAYYSRMGFVDWRVDPAVPLLDGTPVDRIAKVFDLLAGV